MMLGIGVFFALPSDPSAFQSLLPFTLAATIAFLSRRKSWRVIAFALLAITLGFAASYLRTLTTATPLLSEELHYRTVEGRIALAEPSDSKLHLTLSHPSIERLPSAQTPAYIRMSLRGQQPPLQAGDTVRFKANLYPLPAPTMPGGFDFSLYYYFNSIGATGYSLTPVELVEPATHPDWESRINNLRHTIGEDMREEMTEPEGAVAAAMTIGETSPIPTWVNNDLRDSGLYHILSISGFHLAAVTGIVFASLRVLLSLMPRLALRINVKKIAGLLALLAAFAYLALAGYPIPAQRSFIMVAFVFIAILFDRQGISMRSLAFAALLLLLCFPDSLFSASFQLSFAATLAIVSLYEHWPLPPAQTLHGRIGSHMLGIFISSLAASLATAPFIIYDFNRVSIIGILSNMVVLPLASAVIMPAIIMAMLLMPLGLQDWAYVPLQWGTHVMLQISSYMSHLPIATLRLYALSQPGLLLATLGLLWLCLWRGRLRYLGIPMLVIALATITQHRPVDVYISAEATQVLVRLPDGQYTALKGTTRAYAVQTWLQAEGQGDIVKLKESGIPCDNATCTYEKNGHRLIMLTRPSDDAALDAACRAAPDILIAARYLKPTRCPGPQILIGKTELNTHGPHALYLAPEHIDITRTHEQGPRRLWQPADRDMEE